MAQFCPHRLATYRETTLGSREDYDYLARLSVPGKNRFRSCTRAGIDRKNKKNRYPSSMWRRSDELWHHSSNKFRSCRILRLCACSDQSARVEKFPRGPLASDPVVGGGDRSCKRIAAASRPLRLQTAVRDRARWHASQRGFAGVVGVRAPLSLNDGAPLLIPSGTGQRQPVSACVRRCTAMSERLLPSSAAAAGSGRTGC